MQQCVCVCVHKGFCIFGTEYLKNGWKYKLGLDWLDCAVFYVPANTV